MQRIFLVGRTRRSRQRTVPTFVSSLAAAMRRSNVKVRRDGHRERCATVRPGQRQTSRTSTGGRWWVTITQILIGRPAVNNTSKQTAPPRSSGRPRHRSTRYDG